MDLIDRNLLPGVNLTVILDVSSAAPDLANMPANLTRGLPDLLRGRFSQLAAQTCNRGKQACMQDSPKSLGFDARPNCKLLT